MAERIDPVQEPEQEMELEQQDTPEPDPETEPENSEEPEYRPEHSAKPRRKHRKKNYLLRLVVVLALIVAAVLCAHLDYFNVDGIAVIGNEEITDEEIIKQSGLELGGSVFDVHPIIVQHRIKKNLYIEDVNVNRKLPDKVEIVVKERKLLAQFRMGEKFVITDGEGMVLDVSKEEHKATMIEGITVTDADRKDTIKVKETEKLEKALQLLTATDESDLFFKKIEFNGAKTDAYIYDDFKCSGRYEDLMSAISSGTLKKVIYDLYQKGTEKGTVNVYSNDYCFFTPK